jgi:hypothetical protein
VSLPPIEIVPASAFDYTAKYLLKSTQEICPGRFAPEVSAAIMDQARGAWRCRAAATPPTHHLAERPICDQYVTGVDGTALPQALKSGAIDEFPA